MCCHVQELAQRALVAYVRSVFLQPNKAVFDASALPAAEYALSLGLTSVPKLRFLKRHGPRKGAAASEAQTSGSQLQQGSTAAADGQKEGREAGAEQAAAQAGSLSAAQLGEAESDSEGSSEADTSSEQNLGERGLQELRHAGTRPKRSRTGSDDEEVDNGGNRLAFRCPHHSADDDSRRQSALVFCQAATQPRHDS